MCEQPPYSILVRGIEADVLPTCQKYGMAVIPVEPSGGRLAHRPLSQGPGGAEVEPGHPGAGALRPVRMPGNQEKLDAVEELAMLAEDAGLSMIDMALGFVLAHPAVTAPIIGPADDGAVGVPTRRRGGSGCRQTYWIGSTRSCRPGTTLSRADHGWDPAGAGQPQAASTGLADAERIQACRSSFSLTDRVALITGGGKGIGAAIATTFAQAGADIVVTARTASDLEGVAAQVRSYGRRALAVPGDINDLDVSGRARRPHRRRAFGGLDIVVNNAGGSVSRPFLETTVDQLSKSLHFNVLVPFELSRLAVPHLLRREGASILNIGSVVGDLAVRGQFTHSLSKSTEAQLTRLMAAELSPRIRVNGILPGAIETDALYAVGSIASGPTSANT